MRCDTLVEFIREDKPVYDADTGEYATTSTSTNYYCNVTQLSAQRSIELFGEYVEGTLIVRSTTPILFDFNKVRLNGTNYILTNRLHTLSRTSFVVQKAGNGNG